MKMYGRAQNEDSDLNTLSEVNLVAEPNTLRDLASFLYRCADEIEEQNDAWEQENFECNDVISLQFAVYNPALVTD